ncbi:MAG: hypothetical protein AAGK30_10630, partial [Pseudomonadota bacterium]
RHADAVIFTVLWNGTGREQVQEALRMFASVGQDVTGLVLSQINPRRARSYGYDSYGYGYGYGKQNYYTN